MTTVQNPISASIVERIAAYFVGMFVMMVPLLIAMSIMIATSSGGEDPSAGAIITLLLVFAVFLGFNLFLMIARAQTLGMYLMNLQVVDAVTGKPLSAIKYIFLRGLVGQILLRIVPFYGLVDALFIFGQKRQTLHDMIAGSIVVRFDEATKAKLREGGMAGSARDIEYQLAGMQYASPTRLSIGLVVAVGVIFVVLPILSAIILVVINPARQYAEETTQLANSVSKPLDVGRIDILVGIIDSEKNGYRTKILEDAETVIQADEGPSTLVGYYKNGAIQNITFSIAISGGMITDEYYFADNEVIFIRESESVFPKGQEAKREYESLDVSFQSLSYFNANTLIEKRSWGKETLTSPRKEDRGQAQLSMAGKLIDALSQ